MPFNHSRIARIFARGPRETSTKCAILDQVDHGQITGPGIEQSLKLKDQARRTAPYRFSNSPTTTLTISETWSVVSVTSGSRKTRRNAML